MTQLQNASDIDDAFIILNKIIQSKGLGYYFFTHMDTQDAPTIFKVDHYRTNYPQDWQSEYFENRYFYDDPVARRVMLNEGPFYWSDHVSGLGDHITPKEQKMFERAAQYQIIDGIGFSYLRDKNHLYTLTISSPHRFEIYDPMLLAEFYMIGACLVDAFEKEGNARRIYETLSDKEKDVVSYGAIGKTDAEIAILVGVSVNTIRYYWKNIFKKLNSHSRVFSIIKAINLGFINTEVYEVTTETGSVKKYMRDVEYDIRLGEKT